MQSSRIGLVAALLIFAQPAAAHHPMGGTTPATLMQGLLSGFGHPIIGMDHLLFIVAAGIACYYFGRHAATIAVFLAGTMAGALAHWQALDVPYADAWVAFTLILLGVLLLRGSTWLNRKTAIALFGLSGLAHGYAYGEAIVGAEATPLYAYLAGFTLIQFAIALCGYTAARYAATRQPSFAFLKATGGTLSAVGAGFLLYSIAT
jgi:urease accessory protein